MSKVDYQVQLKRWHGLTPILYVVLALIAGFFMSHISYQITLGHLAQDDLASKTSAVLVPASHALFDLPVRWAAVLILALSAILPILYSSRWQKSYQQGIKKKLLPWRWIDLGITMALMSEVVALLSGVQDLVVLKILGLLVLISFILSWLSEQSMTEAKKLTRALLMLVLIIGLLPWLLILVYALATPIYSGVRAPWYVYGLYVAVLVGFTAVWWQQWQQLRQPRDYAWLEHNYNLTAVITKVAFALVLIIGLHK